MLVKAGHIVEDAFTPVADGVELPAGPVIVSLKRLLAEHDHILARERPVGVRLESGESPQELQPYLAKLAVVVLHIPAFRDGRAFSAARLLRTRLGYRNEIRLTGHFLLDQIAFFTRVGVDAFDVPPNISVADIQAALHEISDVYQPSVDGRVTIRDLRARQTTALTS
jgi:uncharacterized protein (DUF934 family)